MQIVIDIDEDVYEEIKKDVESKVNTFEHIPFLHEVIAVGTPLPKGHGNLIDRDALEYEIASIEGYSEYDYECVAREDIEQAPIIIKADTEEKEI